MSRTPRSSSGHIGFRVVHCSVLKARWCCLRCSALGASRQDQSGGQVSTRTSTELGTALGHSDKRRSVNLFLHRTRTARFDLEYSRDECPIVQTAHCETGTTSPITTPTQSWLATVQASQFQGSLPTTHSSTPLPSEMGTATFSMHWKRRTSSKCLTHYGSQGLSIVRPGTTPRISDGNINEYAGHSSTPSLAST